MKILYVCSDLGIPVLGRKGASVHVRSLVSAMTRAGHTVVVATPLLTKSPWELPAPLQGQLLHLPADDTVIAPVDAVRAYTDALGTTKTVPSELRRILYNQQLEAKLLRRFKEAPPDFVYERAALFGTAGLSVARAAGVPLVVELNAPLSLEQATYRGTALAELASVAEGRTLRGADAVLTVSAALRDYVIGLGVQPDRTMVMPNGVDSDLFAPAPRDARVRTRWGIGDGPVLGFVGGLRPWHGVRAFAPLIERLAGKHPGLQLVIAGDGPLRQDIAADLAARRLDGHVVCTGALSHEEVPGLIREFDIALAPYEDTEHLFYFSPLKLFEYMGCGVPVIAAALGQIARVIQDGENGCLYPPGNVGALAERCDVLLRDAALRQRLGRAAAATVHSQFTWRENATRVVELAQRLRHAQPAEAIA